MDTDAVTESIRNMAAIEYWLQGDVCGYEVLDTFFRKDCVHHEPRLANIDEWREQWKKELFEAVEKNIQFLIKQQGSDGKGFVTKGKEHDAFRDGCWRVLLMVAPVYRISTMLPSAASVVRFEELIEGENSETLWPYLQAHVRRQFILAHKLALDEVFCPLWAAQGGHCRGESPLKRQLVEKFHIKYSDALRSWKTKKRFMKENFVPTRHKIQRAFSMNGTVCKCALR